MKIQQTVLFAVAVFSCKLDNGVQSVCKIEEIFKRKNSFLLNYETHEKKFQDRANCKNNQIFNKLYREGQSVHCCYNSTHSCLYENEICIEKPTTDFFIFFVVWIVFIATFFILGFMILTKFYGRRNEETSEASTPPPPYPTQTEV